MKGNKQSFGGVSVIAIGDFLQLKPVFDGWIFNDLEKGIESLAPNLWKDDLAFAELLNRLRENEMTENDFEILDARVVKTDESNYPSTASHLFVENNLVTH